MTTTFTPARSANTSATLAYAATRYSGAAALCAAIRAAAELAPEFAPECEFPDRYAPGLYPFTVPAEHETGAVFYMPVLGAASIEIETEGPASKWPRMLTHPEKPGPFLAARDNARATFAYGTPDGARGSLTVANLRGALLVLADKVHANRGAFDGKARRAAKPSKPAASAPHVAARAMWEARDYAGALQLAASRGALYFGVSSGAGPRPYMAAESVEIGGHAFTLARSIDGGKFHVMHTPSGLGVDTVKTGAPADGFKSHSLALAWIESKMAEDAFRERVARAVAGLAAFDQSAALAHYMAADADASDETAAPVHASAPADIVAAQSAPDAPTAANADAPRYRFELHLIGTDSQRIESRFFECAGPGLTGADSEAGFAELRAMAAARGMRAVSAQFSDYAARVWAEPLPEAFRGHPGAALRESARMDCGPARARCNAPAMAGAVYRVHCQTFTRARALLGRFETATPTDAADPLQTFRAFAEYRSDAANALRASVARAILADRAAKRFATRANAADSIGNHRRAEVLRELAAETLTPLPTQSRPVAAPAVTVHHVSPAEFAHTVAVAQMKSAAATLARASMVWAPDSGRGSAIAEARAGNLSAAPAVLAHLQRIAQHGRAADLRADAADEARALADALAEHARESRPPATQSNAEAIPLPTQSEPSQPAADVAAKEVFGADNWSEWLRVSVSPAREIGTATPEPEALPNLDGLEVSELGPDALADFDREALRERARAAVSAAPRLRIPPGDPRLRIPARFAPVYVLRAGGAR